MIMEWPVPRPCQVKCRLRAKCKPKCNAHCVLLGPKYTMKKQKLSHVVSKQMQHICITWLKWQNIMFFLHRGVERQAKKLFFCSTISGMCQLWPINALRTIQLVPIRSPRTRSCQGT